MSRSLEVTQSPCPEQLDQCCHLSAGWSASLRSSLSLGGTEPEIHLGSHLQCAFQKNTIATLGLSRFAILHP